MTDFEQIVSTMHEAIRKNPVFGDLLTVEDRDYLLKNGVVRTMQAGEVLCRQHQHDKRVFVLITGIVEVSGEVNGRKVQLGKLQSGEVFGEIAALFMSPRIATVIADTNGVYLEIPGEVLEDLIARVPVIRNAIFDRYRNRSIFTSLKSVPIFSHLDEDILFDLSHEASLMTVNEGDIIAEGENGDALYIINTGVARVYTHVDGHEINLSLLRSGNYFGEWALLTGEPRTASVAAINQVEVVRLGADEFMAFIDKHPLVGDSINCVAFERQQVTNKLRRQPDSAKDVHNILAQIQSVLNAGTAF